MPPTSVRGACTWRGRQSPAVPPLLLPWAPSSRLPAAPSRPRQRVPTIVTLHHELGKGGVVADAVGWHRWAGGASARKAAVPPSPVRRAGTSPAKSAASPTKPAAPPAVDGVRGAEVAALTPASLAEVAEFVAEQKARYGEAALPPAGARWAAMAEAAAVYDSLVDSIATLGSWEVAPGAKVPPEARRLAVYMDEGEVALGAWCTWCTGATQQQLAVHARAQTASALRPRPDTVSKEAGCVTYAHDRLRQALAKQRLPWDPSLLVGGLLRKGVARPPSLLATAGAHAARTGQRPETAGAAPCRLSALQVDLRWAAQHAAAALMQAALEATNEACK